MGRKVERMDHNNTKQISDKVASAIARNDRSLASVAEAVGIPKTTFNRKINGRTDFYMGELIAIAVTLGVGLDEFVPDNVPMHVRAAA